MRFRLLAAMFAVCLAAVAQTMSVAQLAEFLRSSHGFIQKGTMTDRQVAGYLDKVKLTERLDDKVIEELQGEGILDPKTLEALHALRDRSQNLASAKPIAPEPKYVQPPPPSSEAQAAIIGEVREYALNYSKNLPDFICTQVTRRFAAPSPGTRYGGRVGSDPSWQSLDTLTIKLSYFGQKEDYKLILVNNNVTSQDYKTLGGSTSTGDFGSMMKEVFEPATEARFEWDHWGTIRGRLMMVFGYRVTQSRSQWHINYERTQDIVPAYHGLIYVDAKTHEVHRITLEAEGIPADFPIHRADTTLDYYYQELSGHKFLLPMKAEIIMATSEYMTKNDTEFRIYRKYSAESDIKFDTDTTPPPLTDDKTKETPPPPPTKK